MLRGFRGLLSAMRFALANPKETGKRRRERFARASVATDKRMPLTSREWFGVFLALAIPLLNVGAPLLWAFGHSREHLKPFARAVLVYEALALVAFLVYMAVTRGAS